MKLNPRVRASLSETLDRHVEKIARQWLEDRTGGQTRSMSGFVEDRANDLLDEIERILEVEGGVELG